MALEWYFEDLRSAYIGGLKKALELKGDPYAILDEIKKAEYKPKPCNECDSCIDGLDCERK